MRRRSEKKRKGRQPRHGERHREGRKGPHPYRGRVQKNPRGFAFLIPEDPRLPDVYVTRDQAVPLLNDDVVEFILHRRGDRASGEIKRILRRGQKEVVGRLARLGRDLAVETPEGEIHLVQAMRRPPPLGDWVIAQFEEYPTREEPGLVAVVESLGPRLLPEHDIPIAVSRFNLPHDFGERAGTEAFHGRLSARREIDSPSEGRKDLRDLPFVTIDGEDAKDFDDAVLVTTPSQDSPFVLYVAIADVSFFVRPGTPLDDEALERSTSVYFPGFCLPMLPESLSNDLCSLNPRTDKLTLTAEMHFDRDGNVLHSHFYESVIRTVRRLTYTEVQAFLDREPHVVRDLKDLEKPLQRAHALYLKLARKRRERGVLDFDLPEAKIQVNARGEPIEVRQAPRHTSHKLIEEFMVAANREVARALRESRMPTLYRVHETPDPQSIEELNQLLRRMGVSKALKEVSPRAFAKLLESTVNLKGAPTIHQAVLRAQKQAKYEPEPKGHFGLALRDYTHFTSPIRRYPDLVVHRSLKRLVKPNAKPLRHSMRSAEKERETPERNGNGQTRYEELGQLTSERERRAMEAERFVNKRKQCWFMEKRIGEEFDALVSGVVSSGLFVGIPDLAVEGFLPLKNLNGYYQFDESHLCLRQRPGKGFLAVGDRIRVRVEEVIVEDGEINFSQV